MWQGSFHLLVLIDKSVSELTFPTKSSSRGKMPMPLHLSGGHLQEMYNSTLLMNFLLRALLSSEFDILLRF